jgi:hypothetical protein
MTTPDSETQRVRGIYEQEAPRYDLQISFFGRVLFGDGRRWVCSQAEGEVLEIAVGTGRNLAHYRPQALAQERNRRIDVLVLGSVDEGVVAEDRIQIGSPPARAGRA